MNIPNFNALKPMSQFGPRQNMAQGYSSGVTNALPAYQQAQAMEKANPLIGRQVALQGLINRPVQGAQQYQAARTQAQPVHDFAGYQARQTGTGNAGYQQALQGMSNPGQYAQALQNYGAWKDAETKRANASGMLSSGFGAMIPGLLMSAIPAAGLAKFGIGAAMGGIKGGPMGAIRGAIPSPTNYLKRFV